MIGGGPPMRKAPRGRRLKEMAKAQRR